MLRHQAGRVTGNRAVVGNESGDGTQQRRFADAAFAEDDVPARGGEGVGQRRDDGVGAVAHAELMQGDGAGQGGHRVLSSIKKPNPQVRFRREDGLAFGFFAFFFFVAAAVVIGAVVYAFDRGFAE